MSPLALAVILLVAGFALAILEVFLPSGGILTILCVGVLVASIIAAAKISGSLGLLFGFIAVIGTPIVLLVGFRLLPHTPLGRRLILRSRGASDSATSPPVAATTSEDLSHMVGLEGQAVTPLRPSGIAEFSGRRLSVVTLGEMVEADQKVKIIEIQGNRVVVEPVATG